MEWLNFRHLYAFWSVCRYGGFQKASERIFVSQSAVSEQVSQLEEYLEEQLLIRTTRSIQVTPAGVDLLKYADEIFNKSSEINQLFKFKKDNTTTKSLRIGMVGGVSRNFMYSLIVQNMVETDNSSIDITDGSYDDLTNQLKSFEVDLVFSLEAPKKKDLNKCAFKKVSSSPICIAGKPELIKKLKSKRSKPDPLNVFVFNHFYEGDIIKDTIEPKFDVKTLTPITTDDISMLRFMAHSNRGVALIPEIGIQEDLNLGLLSKIRIDEVPHVDFYATFLKKGFHSKMVQNFLV
jgi:LysR family transcriptional activator of nhaA